MEQRDWFPAAQETLKDLNIYLSDSVRCQTVTDGGMKSPGGCQVLFLQLQKGEKPLGQSSAQARRRWKRRRSDSTK